MRCDSVVPAIGVTRSSHGAMSTAASRATTAQRHFIRGAAMSTAKAKAKNATRAWISARPAARMTGTTHPRLRHSTMSSGGNTSVPARCV